MKRLIIASVLLIGLNHAHAASEQAIAKLSSATRANFAGRVEFIQTSKGLKVFLSATGLNPNSTHGIHVHSVGKCEGPDYKSAGEHLNPEGHKHGSPASSERHLGDLGNITADAEGVAKKEVDFKDISPKELAQLTGKSVILHTDADDLKSQPAGDSGDRLACGVIVVKK